MFKPGDKVICIDVMFISDLVLNEIYTIERVLFSGNVVLEGKNTYYKLEYIILENEIGSFPSYCFDLSKKAVSYPTLKSDYSK